jgi:DeoR/GlpR family transcriptional regulator of sugar metabolism
MLPIQRQKKILELIRDSGSVSVSILSEMFSVSEETIRRDLQKMENDDLLTRAYGGAFLSDVVRQDVPISIRRNTYREGKYRIGRVCAELIHSGDTIMLDASSTALRIATELKGKSNIIVITNSLDILAELADSPEIHAISVGGDLDNVSLSFTGITAIENLRKFNVDKAFVSGTGISLREGITDSNEMQAHIRKRMLESAQKRIFIADKTKFGKVTLTKIADIRDIDIVITDLPPSEEWRSAFANYGVEVRYPDAADRDDTTGEPS